MLASMASEKRHFDIALPAEQAYALVRQAALQLPGFSRSSENQQAGFLVFERLLGWSNPITVEVRLEMIAPNVCRVNLTAKLLALADPMGFMRGVLDMFQGHISGCATAAAQGQPWPAPPTHDKKGLRATLILLAVLGVILVPLFLFVVVIAMQ
jgi:hypothetical protein